MAPPKISSPAKVKNAGKAIKMLFKNLKYYWLPIVMGLVFAGSSTVLSIIGPNQISKISTLIFNAPVDLSKVTKIAIGLIIIYLLSFLFAFLQSYLMSSVTCKMAKEYRSKISKKINRLPLKYLDNTPTGDILSRITNDVDILSETLNTSLTSIISCLTTIIGASIMMFYYSWKLALIALAIIPVSFILIPIIFKISQKYFKMQQDHLGEVNGYIEEIYSGHNVISVFNGEDDALQKFDEINNRLFSSTYKGNILSALVHPITNFFGNLGYTLIIIYGGITCIENPMFAGKIMPFAIYYRMFNNQIASIADISTSIQTALASSERIFEFLDAEEQSNETDIVKKLDQTTGNVEFKGVNFGYLPEKQILFDLNLKIKHGQKVAIVGSTGAGKTTLVNLLMRFYDVDSGDILIDGVSIYDIKRENVRKLFGMVLQDTWLFEGTIKENIAYGNSNVKEEDIINVCKSAGIHHLIMSQPKGYDHILTEESTFSAGEKQLLTIVRAMLHNSPMLILDEATSSVDTRTEVLIQKAMDKLMSGRTSFIIAHRLSTIINADIIVVMKDGKIVEVGKHNELLEANGVYAGLYKAQF